MKKMNLSRRGFLHAVGIGAGAVVGTRLAGDSLLGTARAATPMPTTVVVVYLTGGLNAIFTGADAFAGTGSFGVTGTNAIALGGGVVIDNALAAAIPTTLRSKVASIGIRHGITDHGNAENMLFLNGTDSAPLVLANAIGGTGAIKAALVGAGTLPNGQRPSPYNGVSLQPINDMKATIDAIAGAANAPNLADRPGMAKGLGVARTISKNTELKHPISLASVDPGLASAIDTVSKPVQPFNQADFNTAYALGGNTSVNSFAGQMAAAELMVRSGANVVVAPDGFNWDSHGDSSGTSVRNQMTARVAPALSTFLNRMVLGAAADRNVVVAILGDFHRSLPGSDHQGNLASLVIGNTLKNATTGKTDANVAQPASTPNIVGLWQLLSAAAKTDTMPFGANPHAVLA